MKNCLLSGVFQPPPTPLLFFLSLSFFFLLQRHLSILWFRIRVLNTCNYILLIIHFSMQRPQLPVRLSRGSRSCVVGWTVKKKHFCVSVRKDPMRHPESKLGLRSIPHSPGSCFRISFRLNACWWGPWQSGGATSENSALRSRLILPVSPKLSFLEGNSGAQWSPQKYLSCRVV